MFNRNPYVNQDQSQNIYTDPYYQYKILSGPAREADQKNYNNKFVSPDESNDFNLNNLLKNKINTSTNIITDIEKCTFTKKRISYINVDSRNRNLYPENIYDNDIHNLPPNPLFFKNQSSIVTINYDCHPFEPEDEICLSGVISKNIVLINALSVKKNSMFVRINHKSHGFDFVCNNDDFVMVEYVDNLPELFNPSDIISDGINRNYVSCSPQPTHIIISNAISKPSNMFGSVPVNYINKKHQVYLLFYKHDNKFILNPDAYLIKLEKKSLMNANSKFNTICIKFCNLFGVPLEKLNTNVIVLSVSKHNFSFDCHHKATINKIIQSGGESCFLCKVLRINSGYPSPSKYLFRLDNLYKNIVQIRIISSVFPKSIKAITESNNKLYWRNLYDGDHIYQLRITPGNYTATELETEIESQFKKMCRIKSNFNNQHIKIKINEKTNIVSISIFTTVKLLNTINNPVLEIPTIFVKFTQATNLQTNFGLCGTKVIDQKIRPFNPSDESLYIYFTSNSHKYISKSFPYIYNHMYKYINQNNNLQYNTKIELRRAFLFNFYRKYGIYPVTISQQELKSINTQTLLINTQYNFLNNHVYLFDHKLKVSDLIITDTFIDPACPNKLFVYEIINIIDMDNFIVCRFEPGTKFKFIYDSIIINFGCDGCDGSYFLDQEENNTLSFTDVVGDDNYNDIMYVNHPDHQLKSGDFVKIDNSTDINGVSAKNINGQHIINNIINDDKYEIILNMNNCTNLNFNHGMSNFICITYSDIFQMFFNYNDTLGDVLGFKNVSKCDSITEYKHCIKNIDSYGYHLNICTEQNKKINLSNLSYFYIVSPELAQDVPYCNTSVSNVFAKIRYDDTCENYIIDSFVPTIQIYDTPINIMQYFNVEIVDPDGKLVDFCDMDHSFTIEITELYSRPRDTDISARINSEIIQNKTNVIIEPDGVLY